MTLLTKQLVDASGYSDELSVKNGKVVATVRNTLVDDGLMVSKLLNSQDGGQSWQVVKSTSSEDADWIIEDAKGFYKLAGTVDLSAGGSAAATVDYTLITAEKTAGKSQLIAKLSVAQDDFSGHILQFDQVQHQVGSSIMLDAATIDNAVTTMIKKGTVILDAGKRYEIVLDLPYMVGDGGGQAKAAFAAVDVLAGAPFKSEVGGVFEPADPTDNVVTFGGSKIIIDPENILLSIYGLSIQHVDQIGVEYAGFNWMPNLKITEL